MALHAFRFGPGVIVLEARSSLPLELRPGVAKTNFLHEDQTSLKLLRTLEARSHPSWDQKLCIFGVAARSSGEQEFFLETGVCLKLTLL